MVRMQFFLVSVA